MIQPPISGPVTTPRLIAIRSSAYACARWWLGIRSATIALPPMENKGLTTPITAISTSQLPIEVACVINSKFPACSTSPAIIMTLRPYKSIILLVRPTESRLAQASTLNIKVVSVRLDWVCSAMKMVVKGQMKLLLETLKNTPAKSSQKREG